MVLWEALLSTVVRLRSYINLPRHYILYAGLGIEVLLLFLLYLVLSWALSGGRGGASQSAQTTRLLFGVLPVIIPSLLCAILAYAQWTWPGIGSPALPTTLTTKHWRPEAGGRASSVPSSVVRVVAMSDTHNQLSVETTGYLRSTLPDGDVFVHSGDFTNFGSRAELAQFNDWLGTLKGKYRYRIVVCGNHDLLCDGETYHANRDVAEGKMKKNTKRSGDIPPREKDPLPTRDDIRNTILSSATHVLFDETVTLRFDDGRSLVVHGSPRSKIHEGSGLSAFSLHEPQLAKVWRESIPTKSRVDLLVTHSPPYGIRDSSLFGDHFGSKALAMQVRDMTRSDSAPKFHVFGHIHESRGCVLPGEVAIPSYHGNDLGNDDGERKEKKTDSSSSAEQEEGIKMPTTFINAAAVNLFHQLRPGSSSAIAFDVPV